MNHSLLDIEPCNPPATQKAVELTSLPETPAALDVYPHPILRRIGLGLGFFAIAILGAFIGAIWVSRYLPLTQPVDATVWNDSFQQQQSLLQEIDSKLQLQSAAIEDLQKPVRTTVVSDEKTQQLHLEILQFKNQMKAQLQEVQQQWSSLGAKLEADLKSRDQELAWVHYQLATSYLDQRRPLEAITELQKALRLTPGNPLMWNQLGYCYLEADDVTRAIQAFQEYVRLNPEAANAHDSLADGYRRAGKLAMAEEEYRKALQLAPTLGSAHYGLGQVYEQMGRTRLARAQYERYISLCNGASNEWAIRAQERLQTLRNF